MRTSPHPVVTGQPSRALAWSFGNTLAGKIGTLVIGVALARILGPEEFGTYAVAFVALLAVLSFNELGVSLAIVRWPNDPRDLAPTVNTIALVSGAVITGALVWTAPLFTDAMAAPEATGLVRLLALCVLLNGLVATPAAVLQRYFRQEKRTLADQVNVWLGAAISLAMAVAGFGALSLVVGRLAGTTASSVILYRSSPIPYRLGISREYLGPLLHFGFPLAGASLVVFAVGYVDQLMVGAALGPTLLGFYVLAFNLANWPVAVASQPLRAVAPALFARMQHEPSRSREAFSQVLRPLASIALPGCLLLAAAAEPIVELVYGAAWAPAAVALRWLAVLAALRIFFELAYDYLVVLGRAQSIFWVQVVWLIALVPALLVGVRQGELAGAALAQVLVAAVVVLPVYILLLHRVGVGPWALVWAVAAPIVVTSGLAVVVTLVLRSDSASTSPSPWTLVFAGLCTTAVLGGLLAWFRHDLRVWHAPPVEVSR